MVGKKNYNMLSRCAFVNSIFEEYEIWGILFSKIIRKVESSKVKLENNYYQETGWNTFHFWDIYTDKKYVMFNMSVDDLS